MDNFFPFLIGVGVFCLIFLVIFIVVESTRCPVCKKAFVVKNLGRLEVGRKKGYRTVTREEKDRHGKVKHRWDEQVRVLTVEYLQNHECTNCHHTWSTTYSVETDNFDDE